jgi:hypothetical protein
MGRSPRKKPFELIMMPYVGEHFGAQTTSGDGIAWQHDGNSKLNIDILLIGYQ